MGKKRVIKKTEGEAVKRKVKKSPVSKSKSIKKGRIYVSASYNNTMMTLTDADGKVVGWTTSGNLGFKGTKKATPYAASEVANAIFEKMERLGMKEVDIIVKGVGTGRSSALRAFASKEMIINSIRDVTPIPHNGCRPPGPRRT